MAEQFKRQHIVPQAYLNRFAEEKGKTYIIGTRLCTEKTKEPQFFTSPVDRVAYRKNYYDTTEQRNPKYWEHYLDQSFDTLCGTPLGNIISKLTLFNDNDSILTTEDIHVLSKIVFSQIVRVPDYLEREMKRVRELADQYKKGLREYSGLSQENLAVIEKFFSTADEIKNLILQHAFDDEQFESYCGVLEEKTWVVFYNGIRQFMPFVTSDNPVLLVDTKRHPVKLTEIGLTSNELVIMFPLSPSLLIGIYPSNLYLDKLKEFDRKRIVISEKDLKFIMDVNTELINNSYVHSFLPEPLYSLIKKEVM